MANLEDEGTSSEPTDELWNIAITSKSEGSDCVPQKSSNEILTELFGAFNAEPPKCALASDNDNDELKGKKHRKKHKKERKHKKKNRNRRRLSDEQDNSSVGYSSESENELEKRKERKHKSKRKHRSKASDIDSGEETKPTKRGRHSQSPSETQIGSTDIVLKDVKVEVPCVSEGRTEKEINGEGNVKTDTVSSSTPASCLTPPLHPISKKDDVVEASVFENVKLPENSDEKIDKAKPTMGKIIIKDLKFSTVYEATVKEVEEQAKAKAEKYEEGEISDNSSPKTSDSSDDPAIETNLDPVPDTVELIDSSGNAEEGAKVSKRPHSEEKSSSHHKKSKHKSRSRSRSRSDHKTKDKDKERHGKHKDRDRDKDRHKEKEKDKHREKGRDRSRDRSRDREKDRERERQRDRDRKDKDHRDRRRGRSRSRSRSRGIRNRSSSRSRRRHSRDRRRTRSRSKDRRRSSGSDHIDKKKLLEIARRNAMNMIQAGILPGTIGKAPPTEAAPVNKSEKTAKTVDELTEYCKELSKRENMGELSSLSGSEDSDSEKPFHHPFQVKDRPSFISLNIKNAVQLPLKTLQEQKVEQSQLRIQFPVSSGQQHRKTESEWVPVVPSKKTEEKKSTGLKAIEAPKRATSTPSSSEVVDIGALVSQRLSALRKKHDSEQIQPVDYMHGWNSALPGQFTGDTGVRLLTPQQLASGAQAWARKDQLVSALPVRSGMGMALLQKMGWKPGEGLGKNKEGCQEPLQLEVKMDRKGLVAAEEIRSRRPPPTVPQPRQPKPASLSLEGKHPVSLLTEYCSKYHYGAPHFELCLESGPDHKKDFLFKVRVNGLEYTPGTASPNKKQAKAEAASVCLKALGVLIS